MSDDLSKVDWGREISIHGRPSWLVDGEDVLCFTTMWQPHPLTASHINWYVVRKIKLRTDHPFYRGDLVDPAPSDDIAKRMEALVRRMAQTPRFLEGPWSKEAREIVEALDALDPDLVEARRIAAEHALEDFHREAVLEGVSDDAPAVKSVLAAIKRGREMAGKITSGIVFEAIQHGDTEHRDWLREALDAVFDGRSVPTPRGKGVA